MPTLTYPHWRDVPAIWWAGTQNTRMTSLEARVAELLSTSPLYHRLQRPIPGIGPVMGSLIAEMPDFGRMTAEMAEVLGLLVALIGARRAYLKRVCRLRFSFFRWFFVLCADALCGLPDGWLRCVRRGTSRDGRSVLRDFVSMA